MLWVEGTTRIPNEVNYQGELSFTSLDLEESYQRLGPKGTVDLVVIGCPQASIGEIRSVVAEVRGRMELGLRIPENRLWIFTSRTIHDTLSTDGTLDILEEQGLWFSKIPARR